MKNHKIPFVPPKVSYHRTEFGTVKVIRSSTLCKLLMVRAISVWNRVYVRDSIITPRMWQLQLTKLRTQRANGLLKNLRNSLTK
jgi:hypothetical protein